MFGMFWIALELGNSKMGLNVILSLLVKKLSAFENDEVAKSGNTALESVIPPSPNPADGLLARNHFTHKCRVISSKAFRLRKVITDMISFSVSFFSIPAI